jgi:4-hydroxybenzoate polyprenyltransferase
MTVLTPYKHVTIEKFVDNYQIDLIETIEKLFLTLTVSSIFIGLAGFFLVYLGFFFLGLNPCILTCSSAALMTFGVYNLDKLTDSDEDKVNMPERGRFFSGRRNLAKLSSVGAYSLAIILTIFSKPLAMLIMLSPVMANAIYASRLYPGVPRLKDIPIVKNITVAFIWATGGALLPALSMSHEQNILVAMVFYFMAAKMFINTVLYDIRDLKGDGENGVKTMPIILGEQKTLGVLLCINSTLLLWLTFANVNIKPLAALMVLYGYFYILYFRKRRNSLVLDFFVDGEWILAGILLLALKGLGIWA